MSPGIDPRERGRVAGQAVSRRSASVRRAEWAVAILLTVLAIGLHAAFFAHAGPLWRDEANSAALATTPTLREAIQALPYDSFPLLPTVVLRVWTGGGWGAADSGFRFFGLAVGIAFLGVLWIAARWYKTGPPLLSLALVGASPLLVTAVDSVRPYGLGVVGMGLTAALVARATAAPSWGRFAWAGVAALVSVQCLYQNAILLLAVGIAAVVAAPRAARSRVALGVFGVGAVAALSLIPYAPSIRAARDWNVLIQSTLDVGRVARVLSRALQEASGPAGVWVWMGAAILALGAVARLGRVGTETRAAATGPDSSRYGALLAWTASVLFLGSIASTRFLTQPWYYVPLLALAAPAIEAGIRPVVTSGAARVARLVIVLAITASGVAEWRMVSERRTNIDRVAAHLEREAVRGDAIVVAPWYLAISFHRYYHGAVDWTTLPPLEDTRIHRYDLLKAAMRDPDPVAPVLESMDRALDSGHRVWLVGGLPSLPQGDSPAALPPPPHPVTGWSLIPYDQAWSQRAARFLSERAETADDIPVGSDVPVQALETVPLIVVYGRRPPPPVP